MTTSPISYIKVNHLKKFRLKTEEKKLASYLNDNKKLYAEFKFYRAKFPTVSARKIIQEMLKLYKHVPEKFA